MSVSTANVLKTHSATAENLSGNNPMGSSRLIPSSADESARLRRAEDRWELLIDAAEQGIWEWVPGTDEMYWSPQMIRMLGYGEDEVAPCVGSFNALIHPDDHDAAWRALDEHMAGKTQLCQAAFRLRAKDGSFHWIESRAKARLDESGKVIRMVGLQTDITARKQLAPAKGGQAERAGKSVDLPPSSAHCGACGSDLLVRSRMRLWEWPLLLLLLRPVRCRTCGRRGFKPLWAGVAGRGNA